MIDILSDLLLVFQRSLLVRANLSTNKTYQQGTYFYSIRKLTVEDPTVSSRDESLISFSLDQSFDRKDLFPARELS
jgi:hypothetical protein